MPLIRPELLDELLKDDQKPEDLLGQDGLLQQLTKALVERALDGELTHHLGYEKQASAGDNSGNSRNGTTAKTMRGKRGQVQIDVPRDRNPEFEPQLVKKHQTRFDGLDEKIISLYARGMTQREIQGHLEGRRIGTLPPNLTVGKFLVTRVPKSYPPESFLGEYLGRIRYAADNIVPH
jgi:putative transposase